MTRPAVTVASTPATAREAAAELRRWWRSLTGDTPPSLVVSGPATDDRCWLLDGLVAELTASNRRLRPDQALRWVRVGRDGAATGNVPEPEPILTQLLAAMPLPADGSEPPRRATTLVLVDDADQLARARPDLAEALAVAAADPTGLERAGVRIVAGGEPGYDRAARLHIPYTHPRTGPLDEIERWLGDPREPPVLAVCGRPGSGKSELLAKARRRLSARDDLVVAHAFISDVEATGSLAIPRLVQDVTAALIREGASTDQPGAAIAMPMRTGAVGEGATVIGPSIGEVHLPPSAATVDVLRARLQEARAIGDGPHRTLLVIIDGLNEIEEASRGETYDELRVLLAVPEDLETWHLRVLLSAHTAPDLAQVVLDLDDYRDDLRPYVRHRLADRGVPEAEVPPLADRIVEISGGLFIVASSLVQELPVGSASELRAWLAEVEPARDAIDYFYGAITRMLYDLGGGAPDQGRAADVQRFLRVLALSRAGMTLTELAAVWQAEAPGLTLPAPPSSSWEHAGPRLGHGPEARFLVVPDDPTTGRFRLLHGTVRAILRRYPDAAKPEQKAFDPPESMSLRAERRRFLAGLSPVFGAGPGWDPAAGRLALAETLPVIFDLASQALAGTPVNATEVEECQRLVRAVLTDWEWLESCLRHGRADHDIPLGLDMVVDVLGRFVTLDGFDTDRPVLPQPAPDELAAPGSEPAASRADGRPARPRYLSVDAPTVAEVVGGYARWPTEAQAKAGLARITARVTRSRSVPDSDDPERPVLWIGGFGTTVEQLKEGYRGQFARLSVQPLPDGAWTIHAELVPVPLRQHPQRARPRHAHPDWGHPVLRQVANNPRRNGRPGRAYPTLAAAQSELELLKREYPDTAILNDGLLFIMVFDRSQSPPIARIQLDIRATDRGTYVIHARPNPKRTGGTA